MLDVRFSTSAFSAQNFSLSAVNQSFTFNFGTIDLAEPNANGGIVVPDESDDLGISAKTDLHRPDRTDTDCHDNRRSYFRSRERKSERG